MLQLLQCESPPLQWKNALKAFSSGLEDCNAWKIALAQCNRHEYIILMQYCIQLSPRVKGALLGALLGLWLLVLLALLLFLR